MAVQIGVLYSPHQLQQSVSDVNFSLSVPAVNSFTNRLDNDWEAELSGTGQEAQLNARDGRPYCPINLILTLSPSLIDF